ncbi:MAG: carotenoid 1,2-hydratase, partial [Myxococcota bacterium]
MDVEPRGYTWWYLDALSDDGSYGITLIGFIGSVFSPYYAWSDWREPEDHVAMNVALYGKFGRWAMTERGRHSLQRDGDHLQIGPSSMRWESDGLTISVDEISCPLPRKLRGRIRVRPHWTNPLGFAIRPEHNW